MLLRRHCAAVKCMQTVTLTPAFVMLQPFLFLVTCDPVPDGEEFVTSYGSL